MGQFDSADHRNAAHVWSETAVMAGQDADWQWLATHLGNVVEAMLGEFAEMMRGSDHEDQARSALADLRIALEMEGDHSLGADASQRLVE